jgi:glycosyltransferase involved in cell wall biosynthesis
MAFIYFAECLVLARELQRRQITRLHNHFANAGAITGYLAAGLLDIPWSFTMHGISETDYPAGLLLGKKIEAASFVACVSYFGRAQAMRTVTPDQWNKLQVVRCGLPLAALPKHTGSKSRKRMICVGRLSPEKGQAGLIDAFASLATEFNDAELIFIGDGPEAESLRARAAPLADKISFLGRLGEQETLDEIASSEILVLSSFMEGVPIVLMEAMAVGTAVIATRVAGIPELVEDGNSGLLFTPSKWDELANCIRRLLQDEALRTKLARNGQKAVAGEFDIDRSASKLSRLFGGEAS